MMHISILCMLFTYWFIKSVLIPYIYWTRVYWSVYGRKKNNLHWNSLKLQQKILILAGTDATPGAHFQMLDVEIDQKLLTKVWVLLPFTILPFFLLLSNSIFTLWKQHKCFCRITKITVPKIGWIVHQDNI